MKLFLKRLLLALLRKAKRKMLIGTPVVTEKDREQLHKARFLQAFVACVLILACFRWLMPEGQPIAEVSDDAAMVDTSQEANSTMQEAECTTQEANSTMQEANSTMQEANSTMQEANCTMQEANCTMQEADCTMQEANCTMQEADCTTEVASPASTRFYHPDGTPIVHRIYSVSSFKNTFPDMNDVQMVAARRHGVSPVQDREEAERRMKELVYVGSDPYFYVDNLHSSIPYLVPRAAVLLHDIGKVFFDSLYIKGIPLHKIIVTSVLRTKNDVEKLRRGNGNATENSCHLYGTTVDICYNRYQTVEDPNGPPRRAVRNDSLKWILSEVLRDFRKQGRCYVKYEVKQGCFHLTVN